MRYSAHEITQMRDAVGAIWHARNTMSYKEIDRERAVEAMLITYMANGSSPDELEAEALRLRAERFPREADALTQRLTGEPERSEA